MIDVFSTRTLPDTAIKQAAGHGIRITAKDFIRISPVLSTDLKQKIIAELNRPDITLLFTSRHAVKIALKNYLQNIPKSISSTWKLYCLSGATKNALLTCFNKSQIIAHAYHAEALSKEMSKAKHTIPLHFFCGNRRRNTLPDFMTAHKIPYREWVMYTTENMNHKIKDVFQAYLFYSPSAVESFFSKNTIAADRVCFSIGATTANALKSKIDNPVIISEKPDTDNLLNRLYHYHKTEKYNVEK